MADILRHFEQTVKLTSVDAIRLYCFHVLLESALEEPTTIQVILV
jgi:hypothetical protein